ncbi:MAG: hypothetical protein WD077_08110 [Bacteroidia bacterium]
MGKPVVLLFLSLFATTFYSKAQNDQYSFAQTYFGAGAQYLPGSGSTTIRDGSATETVRLPGKLTPYLDMGGMHFWGRADFYVSFFLPGVELPGKTAATNLSTGIMTGARYYPIKIRQNSFRPFAGINWSSISYQQQNKNPTEEGPLLNRQILGVEGGISYITGKYRIIEASLLWLPRDSWDYPTGRNEFVRLNFPPVGMALKYKYLLDFTRHAGSETSRAIQQQLKAKYESRNALSAFSFGIGVSSSFPISRSPFLQTERPYLMAPLPITVFPDIAVGYYFRKPDLALRLAFRPMRFYQEAYGLRHELKRKALSLEAFKFLWDYKGFVPFAGAGANFETIQLKEKDFGNTVTHIREEKISYSIVAGWDIRPTDVEWFILRTNVRYTPALSIKSLGKSYFLDHLELNFIQLVLYPQRMKAVWKK